jgi:hypothetical protein
MMPTPPDSNTSATPVDPAVAGDPACADGGGLEAGLDPAFSWNALPLRENAGRAVFGMVAVAGLAVAAGAMMQSVTWALCMAAALLLVLNRFFLPSSFTIDREGITASYPLGRRRLAWKNVRRFATGKHGAWLSPSARSSWVDARTGVQVFFGRDRDAVVGRIRACIDGQRGGA